MNYTARPYRSRQDLYQIGKLIRHAYARQRCFNAWSFCRYDLWALRRMTDTDAFNDRSWQEYFQLLHEESGRLVGAAFACSSHHWRKNPEPYALILDPDHALVAKFLFDWAESSGMFEVEIMEENTFLNDLLLLRGYTRSPDFLLVREKALAGTPPESVDLPGGYSIQALEPEAWVQYFEGLHAVHTPLATAEAPAPRGLHFNVVNDQNRVAAFCSVWLDRENQIAEFEPVGTIPQFEKQGLGAALLAHACNSLREMDCPTVRVTSWSRSIGANKLYEACGLLERSRLYSWKKDSL